MKKLLCISTCLICISNYLFAAAGDYQSIATGNWTALTTWNQDNGSGFVAATDYPGQNTGTGVVTIQDGDNITLNVSPANPIGSLVFAGTNFGGSVIISNTFTLNVTGQVLINPSAIVGIKTISMNGASAQLNCGSLSLVEGGALSQTNLTFTAGGIVNVTGNVAMGATNPQRTIINFAAGGTMSVGGNITGGQITVGGAGTCTLGITGVASTVGNLIMNNATAILDLNGNLTVSNALTLTNGKIDIGPNLLTLSNATEANQIAGGSATAYVYTTSGTGRLVRQGLAAATSFTFPVGTPTNYMPVITNTAVGASNFAVSVYSPASTNSAVGGPAFAASILLRMVNAMWYIDRPVGSGNTAITLQWVAGLEGATFTGLGNTQIGISRHNGTSWSVPPIQTSGNNGTNVVTATFSAFSPFAVADIGQALPVKFGAIKAYEKQNGIQLDWKVYSENKVKNYEIERSADGRSYNTVGSVNALYNNTADGDYGFFDASPLSGTSYYRIKNNDLDGKSAYSIVIRVNRNKTIKGLSIYPNPIVNGIVLLQGSDLGRGSYKINIFGANGQEIYKQQLIHNGGTISHSILLPATTGKGVYMLSVKDENGNIILKEKLVNQ